MPVGPIELLDSVGIDVALHVARVLGAAFGRPIPVLLEQQVAEKKLGRKSGEGFYRWADGKAVKTGDGGPAPADIEDRLILPMVNESIACLHENVIGDPDLLDAGVDSARIWRVRGGQLHFAGRWAVPRSLPASRPSLRGMAIASSRTRAGSRSPADIPACAGPSDLFRCSDASGVCAGSRCGGPAVPEVVELQVECPETASRPPTTTARRAPAVPGGTERTGRSGRI